MNVLEKLPGMSDEALGNLHANAERLEQAGALAQRASAAGLLPAIKAELEGRHVAKQERAAEARRKASEARAASRKAGAASSSAG